MGVKGWLFYLGIINKCPICGSKVLEVGYPKDGCQYYKCSSDKCKFGKE